MQVDGFRWRPALASERLQILCNHPEPLRKSRDFRLKKDPNEVRLELVKIMTELLQAEDKVDRAARTKIRTQKREISEGTEEWELLHKRYYAEELKKLGIDLDAR